MEIIKIINRIRKIKSEKNKERKRNKNFYKKYGFLPPPEFSDISNYEILLDTILQNKIYELVGDFVEIGSFLGGGTYKLSKLLEKLKVDKKVYAVDIFNIKFDNSVNIKRNKMSEIYGKILKDRKQYEIYKEITKNCKNVITIVGDSKKIYLPCKKISFAYIDGNHCSEYARNDFYLVWDKLVSNGIVVFDDYGYDLPQITKEIHQLIGEQNDKILKVWTSGLKTIFIQKK